MVKVVNVEMVVANVNKVDNFMMIFVGGIQLQKQKLLFSFETEKFNRRDL